MATDNRKNLFFVRSPLQLLNAIEAKEHFMCKNNILVMQFNRNRNNTDQMKALVTPDEWDEVIEIDFSKIAKLKRLYNQIALVKKLQQFQYHYLFSGDFGTINKVVIANLDVKEVFLIDDGTLTILTYEKLQQENPLSKLPFAKKVKMYRYRLAGLAYQIKNKINFFTIYNLAETAVSKVIKHDFPYLKSHRLPACERRDEIILLGQNLVEANVLSEKEYIRYVKKIIAHYSSKIYYFPHRSETISEDLRQLEDEHFIINPNLGPIEVVLLSQNRYPSHIVSFYSSALVNLKNIFVESRVESIKIELSKSNKHKAPVEKCYNTINSSGVAVVNL